MQKCHPLTDGYGNNETESAESFADSASEVVGEHGDVKQGFLD